MSVSAILAAIETEVSDYLGSDYKRINFSYELEKNSSREDKAFGIRVENGTQVTGTTKNVTMDTRFEVFIQERFVSRSNDKDMRAAIDSIHDKIFGSYTRLVNTKIGIPNIVLVVQALDFDAPEIDETMVRVTYKVTVKYRNATIA